eukprot:TRINITY_DN75387_c0_g1_i1.p1 TRINITY_DN75387_c0_g1~~TRINITY_DN75387_c0_g1_i1.p1  ORF type:complete len:530 (-),score=103.09 TRINITY_DN75387_c0_g1_i1:237-1826(-)
MGCGSSSDADKPCEAEKRPPPVKAAEEEDPPKAAADTPACPTPPAPVAPAAASAVTPGSGAASSPSAAAAGGGAPDDLGWTARAPGDAAPDVVALVRSKAKPADSMRVQIQLEGAWKDTAPEDSTKILAQLAAGKLKFQIQSRGQPYDIDFGSAGGATQTNVASGKKRRLRLVDMDDGGADGELSKRFSTASADGSKDDMSPEVKLQMSYGPQSRRGDASQHPLSVLKDLPHGQACFASFQKNEERLVGSYAVFYHSYSFAALIYEVHAAVGSVLFRFRSQYATLPRILVKDFKDIPDATSLVAAFNKDMALAKKDHDPRYRAVGLSAMLSMVATGPECCIPMVFVGGYSCKDVTFRGVLENVLESCYVPKAKVKALADQIIALSEKHGLDVSQFGGKACKSGKPGHLLQIFLKRNLVDKLVYAAKPYGPLDNERMPMSQYMDKNQSFAVGQARIVAHPKYFMQANQVRMFVASADPDFQTNRQQFQTELIELLSLILAEPSLREKAATGIYGGSLPSWWTAEDQRAKA